MINQTLELRTLVVSYCFPYRSIPAFAYCQTGNYYTISPLGSHWAYFSLSKALEKSMVNRRTSRTALLRGLSSALEISCCILIRVLVQLPLVL